MKEYIMVIGYVLLMTLLACFTFIHGGLFLQGRYKNQKIECLKSHPGEETHYNMLSGCWYWSERQQKMITPDDSKERKLIEEERRLKLGEHNLFF